MGRLLLVSRLVAGDIRRRPVQSALLLVVIGTTTTTLTLGLTLRHVAQSPFAHTKAATRGPDFVVQAQPKPGSHVGSARAFAPLLHAAGVAASAGPFPLAFVRLTAPGVDVPVDAEGRTSTPSAVNRPLITAGGWVRPGGAVIEQGLADTLDLRVGDRIGLHGQSFRVVGIALQTEPALLSGVHTGPGLGHARRFRAARDSCQSARVRGRSEAHTSRRARRVQQQRCSERRRK
jgi:putative ABC transport system permease protein